MIPRIIHYCWFGGKPFPELARKCISSWERFLPEYEIREWNESNFNIDVMPYVREAYDAKKYAFVSDVARFWILYNEGGLYFDTDVEIIRPLDDIVCRGSFMGFEDSGVSEYGVAPGLGLGVNPGLGLYKEILDYYSKEHFKSGGGKVNLETVVSRVTRILVQHGLKADNTIQEVAGVTIYPYDFFCPIRTTDGKLRITDNTVSIHHYAASWTTPAHRILRKVFIDLGAIRMKVFLGDIMRRLKR